MRRLRMTLSHLTMILALVITVFLILDQFNPLMNFVDNPISRVLLALLCLSCVIQSVLHWQKE